MKSASIALASGRITGWPEATRHLLVTFDADGASAELGAPRETGLDAYWSIASTVEPKGGFFYADVFRAQGETRVAHAKARSPDEIDDLSALDWSTDVVGPVPVGGVVVVEHRPSRRYLALVLERIEATDPRTAGAGPYALADVTWHITAEGAKRFSR